MKKVNSILLKALPLCTMVLTGCFLKGGQKDEDYDPLGRTVLQISVVSKGYGHAFAENLIEAYNKK